MKVSQIIIIGKYATKIPIANIKASKRTKELLAKGYSEQTAYKMVQFELGMGAISSLLLQGVLSGPAIEAGGTLGFEAGLAVDPKVAFVTGIICSAIAWLASFPAVGRVCDEISQELSEKIFDYDGTTLMDNIDLSKIPAFVKDNGPKYEIRKDFMLAGNAGPIGIDPILVDLNGDGKINTVTIKDGVYFDHQKDGFAEHSAWVDENDGILVIDKNGDGVINDGSEIFGDNYVKNDGSLATSGFDALKDLDSNNDGVINSSDENFGLINILKGEGEVLTLEEAGIVSITLNSVTKNSVDENGNTLVSQGTFAKADGTTGVLGDFNLVVDKMNSFSVEWLDESEDIAALPEVLGSGMVYSLRQAMVRDESGELKGLVEDFIEAEGESAKKEILGQILYKWTGAENVSVSSGGYHYDGQKLYVMEQFIGEEFKGVNNDGMPNVWAAPLLDNCYKQIMDYVYYSLMVQCDEHTKTLYNMFELEYDFESNKVKYNFDKVMGYIDEGFKEGKEVGKNRVLEIAKLIQAFGLNKQAGYEEYYEYLNNMGGEYTAILETIGKIVINGTDEADVIEGTTGADAVLDFDYYLNRNNNQKIA